MGEWNVKDKPIRYLTDDEEQKILKELDPSMVTDPKHVKGRQAARDIFIVMIDGGFRINEASGTGSYVTQPPMVARTKNRNTRRETIRKLAIFEKQKVSGLSAGCRFQRSEETQSTILTPLLV